MKIYNLLYHYYSYEEGRITGVVKTYSTREEAEKALEFIKSIPDDPCEIRPTTYSVGEVEVLEKFEPWLSPEQIEMMKEEYEEAMRYDERYAHYEDYDEEDYLNEQEEDC